jgi:hypothetical protein
MSGRWIAVLLASLAFTATPAAAQERPPDQLSRLLFEEYLDGPRKINTTTILAASTIVADRGRRTGFWKEVLAELQSGDEHSEVNCVRILGNMLAGDAAARDAIRRQQETGEVSASIPRVYLGPEVVAKLLERGKKADRHRIDHYVIALARARVPEARGFFTTILHEHRPIPAGMPLGVDVPEGFQHNDGTRFHAAVGLAQLGDPAGFEWLIANCEDPNGFVQLARPYFADRSDIGTCCRAALRQLSGDKPATRHLATRVEWEAWWRPVDLEELTGRAVRFQDP